MNIKLVKIFIITIFIVVAGVEGLFLLFVPAIVNDVINSGKLQTSIEKNCGFDIYFEKLHVKTFPDFSLQINADKINFTDGKNTPLYVENLNLKFSIFKFLQKKIFVKNLTADEFSIVLVKDKEQNIFWGKYPINKNISFVGNWLRIDNLFIKKGAIVFVDNQFVQDYSLNLKNTKFVYKINKRLFIKTDAKLFVNKVYKTNLLSDFDINLKTKLPFIGKNNLFEVTNLDFSDYKIYLKELSESKLVDFRGIIDFKVSGTSDNFYSFSSVLKDFKYTTDDKFDSIISKNNILLSALFTLNSEHLNIKQLKMNSTNFNIAINGLIKKYLSVHRQADLKIEFIDSSVNDLYWLLPSVPQDELFVVQKLKQYGFWGILNGVLNVKGDFKNPQIYGDVVVSDVYISKDNPAVPHSTVNTKFVKDKIEIDTRVFTGYGEYVDVKGVSELKTYPKGEFSIVSTPNVDLEIASYMLVPIHKLVGFDLGPIPYMNLRGKGSINLKTSGTVLDGNAYGKFNFKNVYARLEGLDFDLQDADGGIDFNGRDLHLYTNRAYLNKQNISIDGKANLDGNIDINVVSKKVDIGDLFKILSNSQILETKRKLAEPIHSISGATSVAIRIKGIVKDYADVLRQNNLDIQGLLNLNNCSATSVFSPLEIEKISGTFKFKDIDWNADLNGYLSTSPVFIKGDSNKFGVNLKINAKDIKITELVKKLNLKNIPDIHSYVSMTAVCKTSDRNIDLEKIKANFELKKQNPEDKTNFVTGFLSLNNGVLVTQNLSANIQNSIILLNAKISNIFSGKYIVNGKLNIDNFDLSELNNIKLKYILPQNLKDLLNAYENYQGVANINLLCNDNILNGQINLKDIKFNHTYFKTPISVDAGKIIVKGSKIYLDSIVAQIDNNPMFMNLSVWDLDKNAKLQGYFTSKINEDFVNKYINSKLTYPIKIKGDVTLTSDISGDLNNLKLKPIIKLAQNADIYYMGANIGNEDEERELTADVEIFENNIYNIKKFDYIRFMKSQNGHSYPHPVLTGKANFKTNNKNLYINNLSVATLNKANAKLFNAFFQKSLIKKGLFECKLFVKGELKNPQIKGYVDVSNLDMPTYDTLIKNIYLKFNQDFIDVKTRGVALNSDYMLHAIVKNSFVFPILVEEIDIISEKSNLDTLIDYITQIPIPNSSLRLIDRPTNNNKLQLDVNDIRINKGSLVVKEAVIKDLIASNFKADFSFGDDLVLRMPNVEFGITGGNILGSATYDFISEKIKMNMSALKVDSNKIASSIFGFKDQLFGLANGNLAIVTKGSSQEERLKNMSGSVYFEVSDGKMPKLGSVEYLLRAGNFIKSGLTGLSINNIIDILSPVKTGEFESIKGSLSLKNGVAQNIEVYSKSNNLNLFINGEFDILHQYANMKVYGRLLQKETNILSKLGNISFNSLISQIPGFRVNENEKEGLLKDLNKIPEAKLEKNLYKNFTVKIDGNINEDKYVKNFRWID